MNNTKCYLTTENKVTCFGCEACTQDCPTKAITMKEDEEGFRYPVINQQKCINCNYCVSVCPIVNEPIKFNCEKYAFGGYSLDENVRFESTSGGAFSTIVDSYCEDDYVIFGAESKGIVVQHSCIMDKNDLYKFRKSKYSQSKMGDAYKNVKRYLKAGKNVIFSGTPCQIAGLNSYLKSINTENLLTIEVICEGVPSPLYIEKYENYLNKKYGDKIEKLDYRYKGKSKFSLGKWDFEVMEVLLKNKKRIQIDRWFNPFWSIWLKHLMSRPSCYHCPFAIEERAADISLGDLWGVHLYCPDLYGKNGGTSLIIANSDKGKKVVLKAQANMYGHELDFADVLKYQSPMRKHIEYNQERERFMADLTGTISYKEINKKWIDKITIKLLCQKYVYGNRQKVAIWNIKNKFLKERKND